MHELSIFFVDIKKPSYTNSEEAKRTTLFISISDLGCYNDAMYFLDKQCSGKSTCEYMIANQELMKINPCKSDGIPYLEADFQCVKGKLVPRKQTMM